jgi:tetratricopeptide (TPR) repeat protein
MKTPPKYSPQIFSYLKKYQDDPQSRVFAPLAEAYRRSGLVDEAIEIAREGLRIHPTFVGGRVALARALFDRQSYDEVIAELEKVVQDVPDNLVAQRLFAESCLMRGRVLEALSSFKMLLFFAPQDAEVVKMVKELEGQAYDQGALVLRTDLPEFHETPAAAAVDSDPLMQREKWVKRIEKLQLMLQRVERYRSRTRELT